METKPSHTPNSPHKERLKEALLKFVHSNPSLFGNRATDSYPTLIEKRFSQFFHDFQTPDHPPYAAMIHRAICELNEKGGSSEESISKYIKQEYAFLPWAHSTLLKHHLEKLCDCKEICITCKQCYFLPTANSNPISTSRSETKLNRKQNSKSGKKSSKCHKNPKFLQVKDSPDSGPDERVWTRSQSKKDASIGSKLMGSIGYADMPKYNEENQRRSGSPCLERPLKELLNPLRKKKKQKVSDESESSSEQDLQQDELED